MTDELQGEAKDLHDRWVNVFTGMGLSEEAARRQALEEVRGSGVAGSGDRFDDRVQSFRSLGLSGSAAHTAAVGHGVSESAVRAELVESDAARRAAEAGERVLRESATRHSQPRRRRAKPSRSTTAMSEAGGGRRARFDEARTNNVAYLRRYLADQHPEIAEADRGPVASLMCDLSGTGISLVEAVHQARADLAGL